MSERRVAELEMMVKVLSAGLGFKRPLEAVPSAVLEHLARGDEVRAIKAMRDEVPGRLGLLEAKRMTDEIKSQT